MRQALRLWKKNTKQYLNCLFAGHLYSAGQKSMFRTIGDRDPPLTKKARVLIRRNRLPELQTWAKDGSANHQEMLLRIFGTAKRPAVEAPVRVLCQQLRQRSEVVSLPVVVEDADSYNCFWQMPFRRHARVEIVNQSEKPISLLYYSIDWSVLKKNSAVRRARQGQGLARTARSL